MSMDDLRAGALSSPFDALDGVVAQTPIDPVFAGEAFDTSMDGALLVAQLMAAADRENAIGMQKYMRDQFAFLGVKTPERKAISKPFFKVARRDPHADWSFISMCWALPQREFQYVAADYLRQVSHLLGLADLPRIKTLVESKSWWDTVDALHRIVGDIVRKDAQAKDVMLAWAEDSNFWTRRIAIDHQLHFREDTDTELFEQILVKNLPGTEFGDEFFIQKAIGWSLREYSKTNPSWVAAFLDKHSAAALTRREASKYL
ncbi:3-methyladenine DNA glycosylase AlkD [Arcanobacterium pluranimalium]|uniref:DNA alkylation repair protein n=1 Tax=Arcanobacterium pluranimalium TaxID=108028 RepID=UPI001EF900AF|nr:DNA alkylation repair protein [Arcanobacterium pluranimalium]MBM7824823.1 3-methyladenine DNA glycosylase AlkD [Arcanobacterium pluranimalium]